MKGTRYTVEFNVEAVKQITERGHGLVNRSCLGHITSQEKTPIKQQWASLLPFNIDFKFVNILSTRLGGLDGGGKEWNTTRRLSVVPSRASS